MTRYTTDNLDALERAIYADGELVFVDAIDVLNELRGVYAEIARLRTALTALVIRAPIADLTVLPGAGCAYCHGPHYHSRYEKRMMAYEQEGSRRPPPSGDEATYAPFTEHRAGCPVVAARTVLGLVGEDAP